ncbi:MAG TPA: hypothetical protein VNN62_05140 [Methylomirabilota bacterium]|jgi:hypothetical protein|nr:hypothetical protein [Methylomirabilota bacterium]
MRGGVRRFLIGLGIGTVVLAGAGYAWTFTPSYSLYRIRQSLLAHDYATFSYYVDVDSVLDHALDELAAPRSKSGEEPPSHGPLEKLFKKGILKDFMRDAREVVKAGLAIAVEQAVRDHERPLPEIPAAAVVAALWRGQAEEEGITRFPVKVKKGERIEVRARKAPSGIWRVVEITNLPALLPSLKRHRAKQAQAADS